MGYIKGIVPTEVRIEKWWETPVIHDLSTLKPVPDNDVLLVVGDATGVVDDLAEFVEMMDGRPFDTLCMNYSHRIVPWPIQHFVAGDAHMPDMQKCAKELPESVIKHAWNPKAEGFNVRWIRNGRSGWNGTTANLGIKIGIALGYTRIVLAGVPMDSTGNWYTPFIPKDDVKQGKNHKSHLWKWNEIASRPIARLIRSMSGNTAELFGKPDVDWVDMGLEIEQIN